MGKRGPTPVNAGLLSLWEFEFYKAFHLLRDGTPYPASNMLPPGLSPPELHKFIERLKHMSAEEYWLTSRRVAIELGKKLNLNRPPLFIDRLWAEQERAE